MMKNLKSIIKFIAGCLITIALFGQKIQAQMLPERVKVEAEQKTIDEIEIDSTLINSENVAICNDNEQDIKILMGEKFPPIDTFLIKRNSIWYSKKYKECCPTRTRIDVNLRVTSFCYFVA